jgi:PAS domain S-box-containing protein
LDASDLIFDTADALLAIDREQRIVLWNQGAEALFGFTAEEVLGRYCHEVIGGRDESGGVVCQADCRNIMAMGRRELVRTHDLLVRTKAGQEAWVNVSTILVPSRRKDRSVLVHLFRDIGRHKEMERFVERLLANGAKLSPSQKADPPTPPPRLSLSMDQLTRRQREVLRLLASGASTQGIAKKLFISPATARNHIHHILAKLGVHSRLEAVTLDLRNRMN